MQPSEVQICSLRELDMTGISLFNINGIPPNKTHNPPGFDEISRLFKTVVHLPSNYTRVPMRAGAPPPKPKWNTESTTYTKTWGGHTYTKTVGGGWINGWTKPTTSSKPPPAPPKPAAPAAAKATTSAKK